MYFILKCICTIFAYPSRSQLHESYICEDVIYIYQISNNHYKMTIKCLKATAGDYIWIDRASVATVQCTESMRFLLFIVNLDFWNSIQCQMHHTATCPLSYTPHWDNDNVKFYTKYLAISIAMISSQTHKQYGKCHCLMSKGVSDVFAVKPPR